MSIRISTLAVLLSAASVSSGEAGCPSIRGADQRPTFDASGLRTGRFAYRLSVNGKALGDAVIEIRSSGDSYQLSLVSPDIGQEWETVVTQTFKPLSARLTMRGDARDYQMNLSYAGRRVVGTERDGAVTRKVDVSTRGVVIDQRVDWASMMSLTAPPGATIAVKVFDVSTGASQMVGHVAETSAMTGIWGEAQATRLNYSICKKGHAVETYSVFATKDAPRMMLREEMPNGLVSELIRIE